MGIFLFGRDFFGVFYRFRGLFLFGSSGSGEARVSGWERSSWESWRGGEDIIKGARREGRQGAGWETIYDGFYGEGIEQFHMLFPLRCQLQFTLGFEVSFVEVVVVFLGPGVDPFFTVGWDEFLVPCVDDGCEVGKGIVKAFFFVARCKGHEG